MNYPSRIIFNEWPHISFAKDGYIQSNLAEIIDGKFGALSVYVNNPWKGQWIKHPAQCSLHDLPSGIEGKLRPDFMRAQFGKPGEIRNYDPALPLRFLCAVPGGRIRFNPYFWRSWCPHIQQWHAAAPDQRWRVIL